ncbi:MAG: glycosyltransferase, partial [Verrucomicrobiales bacterium]|nr:glycosyltransferase [Verrucomicrobiales bacterium]
MLATSFACLALLGAVLLAWQWLAGARFPLDRRFSPAPTASPRASVSILKPVTGADPGTSEAIATWLSQDFPGSTEILFGVASTEDPAFALVEDLLRRFPGAPARLLVCPVGQAPNRKVSKLIHLARASSGRVVVISDADVSVPRDLLSQSVPLLDDPATGLVHCLYRIADAPTAAVRWEALIVNADFWSQVLQNQTFKPLDYALGAVMMLRRDDLVAIGGFEALAEHLADDNRLGKRVVDLGRRTRLSPLVVDCRAGPANWASVWSHQLRWAITIRVCQPWPYFLSILANGTVWPLLWALAARSTPVIWTASCLL